MPEQKLPSDAPQAEPLSNLEERIKQRQQVFSILLEMLKPWLFEFGNWIFGGLIAFILIIMGAILTVGPSDPAILISITMFACALPLNVTGLILLKLIKDMSGVSIDDVMRKAFQDANIPIPEDDTHGMTPETRNTLYKKGIDAGLRYSMILASVSGILTTLGVVAVFWHMAWWVALIFVITVILSCLLVRAVLMRWLPQKSATDQEMLRRYREAYDAQKK